MTARSGPLLAFIPFALLIARPVAVMTALAGTSIPGPHKAFIAWFGPKGVASMLFALLVLDAGVANGLLVFDIAAFVDPRLDPRPRAHRYGWGRMDRATNEAAIVTAEFEVGRVEVGEMHPSERDEAIAVIARAMSDSPSAHRGLRRRPRAQLPPPEADVPLDVHRRPRPAPARGAPRRPHRRRHKRAARGRLSAHRDREAAPGAGGARGRPSALPRVGRWLSDWERRDPDAPHSHYGPFGVEPALQGRGIGSLVLGEYTRRLDADGLDAYLETDKPENVALYSRFGFEVIDEGGLLGTPNWFMWRQAGADAPATPRR